MSFRRQARMIFLETTPQQTPPEFHQALAVGKIVTDVASRCGMEESSPEAPFRPKTPGANPGPLSDRELSKLFVFNEI